MRRLLISVLITGFSIGTIYSQQLNECEISKDKIVSNIILRSDKLINPSDVTSKTRIAFNEDWIEQVRKGGQYCREKYLRDISKEELKRNYNLRKRIEAFGKDIEVELENQTFYRNGKIYGYEAEFALFNRWLEVNTADYNDEEFLTLPSGSHCALEKKFRMTNLSQFLDIELKIVRHNSYEIVFAIGDSLIVGGLYDKEILKEHPMLKDMEYEKRIKDFKLDSTMVGKKVILEPIDNSNFSTSMFPFYRISQVKFQSEGPILLFEEYDSFGKREGNGFIGYNLKNPDLSLYDYDCSVNKWKEEKLKHEQEQKEFDTYLRKKNFTEIEIRHIKANTIFIGMREEALYLSLGPPARTNTTVVKNLESKQCVYGDGIFVYVTNGKVSGYQNIESLRD